jgi:hypothetical protein
VTTQESTVANADLWGKYFEDQWRRWLTPLAGPDAARVAAANGARIANMLTFVAAGPVAWLYANSAPRPSNVTSIHSPEPPTHQSWADLESVEEHAA